MNVQTYELDRLRAANATLTIALESAVITTETLIRKHGPFVSTDGMLVDSMLLFAKAALKNNKG